MSSALNLNMTGIEAPSGNTELTMSSLSRTLLVASSMSVPYSKVSVSSDTFSLERELSSLRFSTPFKAFSSTLVRLVSISAALAPGYEDITMMVLESNSGNWAILVRLREKIPNIMKAMKTRAVVTGLLTALR